MIETTITKIQYDADGVQRRWSIPFQYADAKHISIYTKVGNEPTVKVADNYDIDEDDSVVIYPTVASGQEPLVAGTKITIARETPETQLEDASQVHFTSKDVERGLDKLTMITQELSTTAGETMEVSSAAFESAEGAVNSAAQANKTAEEAKTIVGQAVGIATDAKSIAEGIDAKATQALDNSNTAINTANSAKQTAEGIDSKATQALTNSNIAVSTANSAKQIAEGINDKATQALANSTTALETATEAKNTADSYQGQITTIESKIPNDATEQNKLVTKTQMETAVAGSSGFDFEGTKAEFDAAVAAGTITEDSVSLITDDVSGDNVATKAELQAVDSSKADTSLSNTTPSQSFKEMSVGWGMPDYSAGIVFRTTFSTTTISYTAPCDGLVQVTAFSGDANSIYLTLPNGQIIKNGAGAANNAFLTMPILKNQTIDVHTDTRDASGTAIFYPLKGVN